MVVQQLEDHSMPNENRSQNHHKQLFEQNKFNKPLLTYLQRQIQKVNAQKKLITKKEPALQPNQDIHEHLPGPVKLKHRNQN